MSKTSSSKDAPLFLGIEGGGTRTVAILADVAGHLVKRVESGPANLTLLTDAQLVGHFRWIGKNVPKPSAICVGLAGLRSAKDRARILSAAAKIWPDVPCAACADLDTALAAAEPLPAGVGLTRVLVLSGTGSCCYGRTPKGQAARIGGWGHLLGDKGSAYEIGLRALKATVFYYDRDGIWPGLGAHILRALLLNSPEDLIAWAQAAEKRDMAALALEVFAAWRRRDKIASDILEGAAESLAKDAVNCARRLVRPGTAVQFILAGSVLLKQPRFRNLVAQRLTSLWPEAQITPLRAEGAWGAVKLAQAELRKGASAVSSEHNAPIWLSNTKPLGSAQAGAPELGILDLQLPEPTALSATERRNPRSEHLDKMPLAEAIRLMLSEEAKVPSILLAGQQQIERSIQLIVHAFRQGGRLIYVGAGTSGRLGALDASECPPTFRAAPSQVQGIIAGGRQALWESIEGAEDEACAGAEAVLFRGVNRKDVVVGIAASGRTPFVWGALHQAKRSQARTILISFNPYLRIYPAQKPDVIIASDLGPEVLTGSTRLKAGTATKLLLNILTTLSMVRLGKAVSNLMVDLNPSNRKLRERAIRIVRELTGTSEADAARALHKSGWVVKRALERLR